MHPPSGQDKVPAQLSGFEFWTEDNRYEWHVRELFMTREVSIQGTPKREADPKVNAIVPLSVVELIATRHRRR